MKRKLLLFICMAMLGIILTSQSYAGIVNLNVTITAATSTKSASQNFAISGEAGGNGLEWDLGESVDIVDGRRVLGTIESLKIKVWEDPAVSLEFYVIAMNANTLFTITAAPVVFPAIDNPQAYATAGLTLTDRNQDGASITGAYAGGKSYEALYNGPNVYADLVSSFNAGVRQTITQSEGKPPVGFDIIAGSITSIQSEFKFTLSANDSASGTSYFEVIPIPEPATIAMLGLGSLLLLRKRRA
jgi:hypothetical protein